MSGITDMFAALWEVWKEMASAIFGAVPKIISFILWILCAVIVLPCVFVAGSIYPAWSEWGEHF